MAAQRERAVQRASDALEHVGAEFCEAFNDDVTRVKRVEQSMPSAGAFLSAMQLLDAVSDPVRARILYALGEMELCVCELGELMQMSLPAVSHHIRVLRETGFIEGRKRGRFVFYSPTGSEGHGEVVELLRRLIRAQQSNSAPETSREFAAKV